MVDRHGHVLLDTLVRPDSLIPQDAIDVHGIHDASVVDAPPWPEVYPLLGRILDRNSPVVIYNSDFDARMIDLANRRHGLPPFSADWHCAMKQYAAFAGIWHPRYEGFRWHKLTEALRMVNRNLPVGNHRALADADSCRQVVEAMASESAPAEPVVIPPGGRDEDEHGSAWSGTTRDFPGGQVTVVSTSSRGCSTGLLLAILFVGAACILLGTCAFFYSMMALG